MKTTVDIPEAELQELLRHTGAETKKEAINAAIAEFNRRRRVDEAIKLFGTFTSIMTNEEIEELDRQRQRELFGDAR